MTRTGTLMAPSELAPLLGRARLLDARPGEAGREAYLTGHLPGAVHADLERDLATPTPHPENGGRHPLPDLGTWTRRLGEWGIGAQTEVVIYDGHGGANSGARAWWMLRSIGHRRVAVLDGGLSAAVEAGLPLETEIPAIAPLPPYPATRWQWPTVDLEEVETLRHDPAWRLLDVRAASRYRGEQEPFDPVAGHIPGAVNLPYQDNLGEDGRFRPAALLADRLRTALGDAAAEQVVVYCGSGVTACHTLLAMEHAGLSGAALYVGSWSEWCRSGKEREP